MSQERRSNMGMPGRISGLVGLIWLTAPVYALLTDSSAGLARKIWVLVVAGAFVAYVLRIMLEEDDDEDDDLPTRSELTRALVFLTAIDVVLTLGDRPDWGAVMSVYVVAFIAMGIPTPVGWVLVGVGTAAAFGLQTAGGMPFDAAGPQALVTIAVGYTLAGVAQILKANRELRQARAELARLAVAEERRRFARDLHDLLGHSLSLIAIKARLAQRLHHSDPERATQELADIENAARTSLAEVREAVSGYRRATIAGELVGVRSALESAGVELETRVTRMSLDAEDEAVLAWALREATTNVVRHSGAKHVTVRLEPKADGARLEVDDDGRGGAPAGGGSGLRGLAERVAAREGRLETGSRPEGGFRLAVELPGGA